MENPVNDFSQRIERIFHDQILSGKKLTRANVEETFNTFLSHEAVVLSRAERQRLFNHLADMLLGVGPLEPLLQDNTIMEIMVNRHDEVYVERMGKLELTDVKFESEEHLRQIANNIAVMVGREVNESHPIADVRLADGSRVNIVIPPIALRGTSMTIRRLPALQPSIEQLLEYGSFTPQLLEFVQACIKARLNLVVSGGTGSGKTTILNRLMELIPQDERIVTIENAAELQFEHNHLVRLESRPANTEGRGEVSMRDLVITALRMRPERIVVSEVRSSEVIELLQAMNTGHDGSMFTIHANSPRDALARLEVMATMAGMDIPLLSIREQLAQAVDIIIQQTRLRDGSRKFINIAEVTGMQNNVVTLQNIFTFVETGYENGRIVGEFVPTGVIPKNIDTIRAYGSNMPDSFFSPER